ncbi:lysophospholipid acyltransferase family protein [Rhodohalobacter sp. 8-1]|uniref:lysophospholipid acyltransferase family protein n=1 Tax=Rhodohalobacter sp. 8-1 TaxID=3131972 RepID=UPI0030EEF9E7
MRSIYAFCKIISVVAVTLGVYSAFIAGYGVLRLFDKPVDNWRNKTLSTWGRWAARTLSIKVHVKGHVPEPPFFMVSNHLSYIDIIVLFSQLKTTFVAKSEVADWPVLGFIARTIGVVFIDRKRRSDVARVNEEISNSVTDNRGLTLFPEGTTSPGCEILPFRAALLEYPARSKLGAHYCALWYSTENGDDTAYKVVNWWENISLNSHLTRLAKEKVIHATISFGDKVIKDNDRKILSRKLHKNISQLFNPMCSSNDTKFEPLQF